MHLFSDETLFYIFYAMPRDSLQLAAASELYSNGDISSKHLGSNGIGGFIRNTSYGSLEYQAANPSRVPPMNVVLTSTSM